MRAQISIVIPTLEAEGSLPDCLSALIEGVMAGLVRELIVSDGGSRDRTALIADAAGAVLVAGSGGREAQVRRGVAAARAEWLLVLSAETVLAPGWSDAVAAHMAQGAAPGCFRLRSRARGVVPALVAGFTNLGTVLFGRARPEQGLLVPRRLHEAAPRLRPVLLDGEALGPVARPLRTRARSLTRGRAERGATGAGHV